jgi:hypothetical protein
MTPQVDFERYTQIRDRIKAVINQLKSEGVTAAELIEACRSELQVLHIEDYRNSKANAAVIGDGSGAGSLPNDQLNRKD